jgi:hypothetical protein
MLIDTKCSLSLCNNQISLFRYKATKQWNIQGYLCNDCYSNKLTEHYISTKKIVTIIKKLIYNLLTNLYD